MSPRGIRNKNERDYRTLSARERAYLERLLAAEFPGCDVLAEQLAEAKVRQIDEFGSLDFYVRPARRAKLERRIPIEGQFRDADGTMIHLLLHVLDGAMDELEVFKEDLSEVIELPPPEDLEVLVP